jgi:predicted small lipoprotein YifL
MKRLFIVVISLAMLSAIGACGQRGNLVLPTKPDPIAKPEQRKSSSNPETPVSPKLD